MKDRNNRMFGYLYDFWVFVVGQSTDEIMTQGSKLQYENEKKKARSRKN